MTVSAMNHFTILTDRLDVTLAFYAEHLGLRPGARPPFNFPGAWLYPPKGSDAILHVVGAVESKRLVPGVIDHMAFSAHGLASSVAKLQGRGIAYDLRRLPGLGTWQLFFLDPNGARVELDFDSTEEAPVD